MSDKSAAPTLTDEVLVLADALADVKERVDRFEADFSTQSKPLDAAASALQAALAGIKALQFHILDNSLGALSQRVEDQRRAIDEQVGTVVAELRKADAETADATKQTGAALSQKIASVVGELRDLRHRFSTELERVQLEGEKKIQSFAALPGPQGTAGKSPRPRGQYNAGEIYQSLDIVSALGGSYISSVDNNTEKPSPRAKNWTQLASRGGPGGGSGDITGLTGVAKPSQIASGVTAFAVGDILYANSTGTLTNLAAGTSGYVLQAQGANTAPIWAAVSGAGLGDFSGPASSTDGEIVRFNGTSGKNGKATGNATLSGNLTVSGTGNSTFSGDIVLGASSENTHPLRASGNGGTNYVGIGGGIANKVQGFTAASTAAELQLNPIGGAITTGSGLFTIGGNLTVSGTGASSVGGTFATGAPTGGAGAWKLGVANAVSPTSPNRTITVDIGGTLYYIHAKTTND